MNLSSSAVTAVSDVVTVEVKLHTKEAKVLIWEMGHLGQQLNYHGLYKGEILQIIRMLRTDSTC